LACGGSPGCGGGSVRLLEVFPPIGYPAWWTWLAVAAVVAVVLVPLLGWWLTRPKPVPPPPQPPPPDPDAGRKEALASIGAVREALGRGALTPKRASQELSRIVREFVGDQAGLDLQAMTLLELRADTRLAPVAELVSGLYEPAFSRAGADVAAAARQLDSVAARAEQLVAGWR